MALTDIATNVGKKVSRGLETAGAFTLGAMVYAGSFAMPATAEAEFIKYRPVPPTSTADPNYLGSQSDYLSLNPNFANTFPEPDGAKGTRATVDIPPGSTWYTDAKAALALGDSIVLTDGDLETEDVYIIPAEGFPGAIPLRMNVDNQTISGEGMFNTTVRRADGTLSIFEATAVNNSVSDLYATHAQEMTRIIGENYRNFSLVRVFSDDMQGDSGDGGEFIHWEKADRTDNDTPSIWVLDGYYEGNRRANHFNDLGYPSQITSNTMFLGIVWNHL